MITEKEEYQIFGRTMNHENIAKLFCIVVIAAFSLSCILQAISETFSHEIDSYMLPALSIQYRHSIIITQEDIDRARIDFPDQYTNVYDFDSLRSSRLVKITEDKWLAYYFPLYTLACVPLKMLFQLIGADQANAFSATNALLVISALIYLYRKLDVSFHYKLLAVLLYSLSPIYMYIRYISAEAAMFSLITITLVMYSNRKYKSAAFLISAASMPNPTVMGIGIVMVTEYLVKMFRNRETVKIFSRKNILDVLKYGCCYVPCLIPFIVNFLLIRTGNPTSGGATLKDYGARVLTYFFDISWGFSSFAPVTLMTFIVLTIVLIKKKSPGAIVYAGFLLLPVLAYSLMIYINAIPTFCPRYVMWTYPTLLIGTILAMDKTITGAVSKHILSAILAASAAAFMAINHIPVFYYGFNDSALFMLENFPSFYNPYHAIFYGLNDQFNLPYDIDFPSYYFSEKDGNLRKVLFRSTDEYKKEVIGSLKGSEDSLSKFSDMINKIPSDGKFHYINLSPLKNIDLKEKTSEERGLMTENETILQINDSFAIGDMSTINVIIKTGDIYKLEFEMDERSFLRNKDSFMVSIGDYTHKADEFIHTDKNKYSLTFSANSDDYDCLDQIYIYASDKAEINSLRLTSMTNTVPVTISDSPVKFSGGGTEDSVLYPAPFAPMSYYAAEINIPDAEKLTENDEIYLTLYFDADFNSFPIPRFQITGEKNRFYFDVWDTTTGTGPVCIKIYGKTEQEIEIGSVTIELAQ